MSLEGEGRGAPAAPSESWRAIVAAGLIGMVAGLGWGIADQPRYTATASVITPPGGGSRGGGVAELERFSQLGASSRVAKAAAKLLGDDVPGADLLSDVSVVPDPSATGLIVSASSEQPDFAAAAADGYAEALVRTAAARGEGDGVKPLELGAAASLPASPSENRSGPLWAGIGLLGGLLLGALGTLVARRMSRPPDPRGRIASAAGSPVLASLGDPASAVRADGAGRLRIRPPQFAAFRELVDTLDLGDPGAPRTIAVLPDTSAEDPGAVAVALAVAAAEIGLQALLVEADLASPEVASRFDLAPAPGLGDYLAGRAEPGDVLRTICVEAGAGGPFSLICVPAGLAEAQARLEPAAADRLAGLTARLRRVYDVVVFAAPSPLEGNVAPMISERVDGVILVVGAAGASDAELGRRVEGLARRDLLGEVVTGMRSP